MLVLNISNNDVTPVNFSLLCSLLGIFFLLCVCHHIPDVEIIDT